MKSHYSPLIYDVPILKKYDLEVKSVTKDKFLFGIYV